LQIEFAVADYVNALALPNKAFSLEYENLTDAQEYTQSYQLSYKTVDAAIKGLVKHFGNSLFSFLGLES
jgi:hypothetical protein